MITTTTTTKRRFGSGKEERIISTEWYNRGGGGNEDFAEESFFRRRKGRRERGKGGVTGSAQLPAHTGSGHCRRLAHSNLNISTSLEIRQPVWSIRVCFIVIKWILNLMIFFFERERIILTLRIERHSSLALFPHFTDLMRWKWEMISSGRTWDMGISLEW